MRSEDVGSLIRYDLGPSGLRQLKHSLSAGLRFATNLSRHLEETDGQVFTFAPPDVNENRLFRWEEGGLLDASAGLQALVTFLQPRLRVAGRYLIAENAVAKRTDPALKSSGGQRFFVHDEVYEYTAMNATSEEVRACLRRSDAGYSLNGGIATLRRAPRAIEDPSFLLELQPVVIIARSYDGEGFLVWERSIEAASN